MIASRHIAPVNYWGLTKQVGPWKTTAIDKTHEALGYDSPHNQIQQVRPYQQNGSRAPTYEQVEIVSEDNINGLRGPGLRAGKIQREGLASLDARRLDRLEDQIVKKVQTAVGVVGGDQGSGTGGVAFAEEAERRERDKTSREWERDIARRRRLLRSAERLQETVIETPTRHEDQMVPEPLEEAMKVDVPVVQPPAPPPPPPPTATPIQVQVIVPGQTIVERPAPETITEIHHKTVDKSQLTEVHHETQQFLTQNFFQSQDTETLFKMQEQYSQQMAETLAHQQAQNIEMVRQVAAIGAAKESEEIALLRAQLAFGAQQFEALRFHFHQVQNALSVQAGIEANRAPPQQITNVQNVQNIQNVMNVLQVEAPPTMEAIEAPPTVAARVAAIEALETPLATLTDQKRLIEGPKHLVPTSKSVVVSRIGKRQRAEPTVTIRKEKSTKALKKK